VQARILAIANCKGGTGKSTVTVNLAAEFGARGHRVLVVDLDPQGHAGLGFGAVETDASRTAHVAFSQWNAHLANGIRATCAAGVDLLPADRAFDGRIRLNDPRCLAGALQPLRADYDLILLDSPPSAANVIVCALLAADGALVPTALDYLALDGVRQFVRAYHNVMVQLNATLLGLAIAPMNFDFRTNIQKLVLARLLSSFGHGQVIRGIRTDVSLAEAFGAGVPLRHYRPATRAIEDFRLMAEEVTRRFNISSAAHAHHPAPASAA
jgi:chromosome partitioning protein